FLEEVKTGTREYNYASPFGRVHIRARAGHDRFAVWISPMAVSEPEEETMAPSHPPAPAPAKKSGRLNMDDLFNAMLDVGASDLHIKTGRAPMVRLHGEMAGFQGWPVLSVDDVKTLIASILPARNQKELEELKDTDFAHQVGTRARMRCNVFEDI